MTGGDFAVTIPGRTKVSMAELQRKKRKHSKRAAQGTAAAARAHTSQSGASLPLSATPEDQQCVAAGCNLGSSIVCTARQSL